MHHRHRLPRAVGRTGQGRPGKVITAGYSRGYGYMVEIDHGDELTTRFAHLNKIVAKKGQSVVKGDVIDGRAAPDGRPSAPSLRDQG